MLKISLVETSSQCRVILEGQMVGVGVKELKTMWARLKSELNGRALVIDIKDVTLISQEAENALLGLIINHGAKLCPHGLLAKCVLQHLPHRSKKEVSELIESTHPTADNTDVPDSGAASTDCPHGGRSRAEVALELTRGWAWEYDVAKHELYRSHDVSMLFGKPVGSLSPTLDAYLEHIHPDDRERMKSAFTDAISNRTGYDLEFRVVWPDGSVHWMAGRGRTLLDPQGKPCKLIGVDMDVTERKSFQQVVVDSEKLVTLGRMSSTLVHELSNPLTAVQNALRVLEESGDVCDRQNEFLRLAANEAQRAVEIVRSTLGLQREASIPVAVDLRALSDEVLTLFAARLRQQTIRVIRNYREMPRVVILPGQIRQVLVNGIGNAVDAMPNGGALAIHFAPRVNSRGRVRLLVCDSGPGISQEMRARVFEPFFTSKGESGSGIGLWISKQIIEKHGGLIRLHSCQGRRRRGTCVSISLPLRSDARSDHGG